MPPPPPDLSIQEAADVLNVSAEYVITLMDTDRLPFVGTGVDRRVPADVLAAFKAQRDRDRDETFTELIRLSQELGGYDELK